MVSTPNARAARDEMRDLIGEFQSLIDKRSVETRTIDTLESFIT
jgi:hypothetical protein